MQRSSLSVADADFRMNENERNEFLRLPNEKLYFFNKIRSEIVRDTGRRRDAT